MKKVVFLIWTICLIVMVVGPIRIFAEEHITFRKALAPYIEMYGQPTVSDRYYDKESGWNFRMRQWDNVGIQIIFINILPSGIMEGTNGWVIYGIFGRCRDCGEYHISLSIA